MASELGLNATLVLDALVRGLVLKALTDGFALDAVSNALKMSKLELMSKLTPQAPLSNLHLIPILGLEPLFNSTLAPAHLHNHMRQVPTSGPIYTGISENESEDSMKLAFDIAFWTALMFVLTVALLALCAKVRMAADRNWEKMEQELETKEPENDLEKWCLRRKLRREFEAKKRELERLSMEVKGLEKLVTGQADE